MRFIAIIAVITAALSACSVGTETSATFSDTGQAVLETTAEPSRAIEAHGSVDETGSDRVELSLELDDSYFKPTFIEIDDGATLDLELENEGRLDHTFTIDSLSIDKELAPGKKVEIEFVVEGTGTLPFYYRIHSGTGMAGELRLA